MVEFKRGNRRVQVILTNNPVRGVIGVVECPECEWKLHILAEDVGCKAASGMSESFDGKYDVAKIRTIVDNVLATHACGKDRPS